MFIGNKGNKKTNVNKKTNGNIRLLFLQNYKFHMNFIGWPSKWAVKYFFSLVGKLLHYKPTVLLFAVIPFITFVILICCIIFFNTNIQEPYILYYIDDNIKYILVFLENSGDRFFENDYYLEYYIDTGQVSLDYNMPGETSYSTNSDSYIDSYSEKVRLLEYIADRALCEQKKTLKKDYKFLLPLLPFIVGIFIVCFVLMYVSPVVTTNTLDAFPTIVSNVSDLSIIDLQYLIYKLYNLIIIIGNNPIYLDNNLFTGVITQEHLITYLIRILARLAVMLIDNYLSVHGNILNLNVSDLDVLGEMIFYRFVYTLPNNDIAVLYLEEFMRIFTQLVISNEFRSISTYIVN